MSNTATVITTKAGEALIAQMQAENKVLVIDKFIFANVPNRPAFPNRDDVVPTEHVVHESAVHEQGRLTENSVIYSTTLASNVGPFSFNWSGLFCSEHNVLVAINFPPPVDKTVDAPGITGNTLVRSFVLEYKGIAETTNITVDPSSWQYDAHKRMSKMDNDTAQAIIDQNGKDWFIDDGFIVTPQSSAYSIKAGAGYVSGHRISLDFDRIIQVPEKPAFIYVDAFREGSPTGEWQTKFTFVVAADEKDDYTDAQGVNHFVCKIAQVFEEGSVSILRKKDKVGHYVDSINNLHTTRDAIEWRPNLKVKAKDALQLFEHGGRFYLPCIDELPFTTGATFNAKNWVLSELVTTQTLSNIYFTSNFRSGDELVDFIYEKCGFVDSLPSVNAVELLISKIGFTVMFNKQLTSTKPLPLISGVKYQSVKSIKMFARSIDAADFHYAPANLNTAAVEPVLYVKQPDGSFLMNKQALLGTPDNPNGYGDKDYVTCSGNAELNIYISTSPRTRLGLNQSYAPQLSGSFGVGVQEDGSDNVSAPQVGWFASRSWASKITKPYVFGRNQAFVCDGAFGGSNIDTPYFSRNGTADGDALPVWSTDALKESGHQATTAITVLNASDFTINNPITEHYSNSMVVSGEKAGFRVTKPHIETYNDKLFNHSILTEGGAVVDVDNWTNMRVTAIKPAIYALNATSTTSVALNGMGSWAGFVGGLVDGSNAQPFLSIESLNQATADYGKIGNFSLITVIENIVPNRTVFIDAVNGDDENVGIASRSPVKTISAAVERCNKLFESTNSGAAISLKTNVVIDTNVSLRVPTSIYLQNNTLSSTGRYIEITEYCGVHRGELSAEGSCFRVAGDNLNLLVSNVTANVYSLATSVYQTRINIVQDDGDTSNISRYVDGGGQSLITLNIKGIRNLIIDDVYTVSQSHLVIAKKYS
ncbi:phage tail protein [Photobacterium toruni]|uniref:Phage tail protein n=1 Tax=Photobacterium toruni TaxID=1935446 RepID=A0ABU6L6V9_9GAMM|nr:phage tail protein [Photobacterium toruni]